MDTATVAIASPRQLARRRRADAFRANWRAFARQPGGLLGLVVLVIVTLLAVFAPVIADVSVLDPTKAPGRPFEAPSAEFWFGTDHLGRPVLPLLIWGARTSLTVGIAATIMSMVIGTLMGLLAGTMRGWRSAVIMRVIDFFLVIPGLVLAIVLGAVLGSSTFTIVVAIGVTSWAGTARMIRAQTLSLESRGYVERSRALGASQAHITWRHILPGVMPLVLANTSLAVGVAIISEATLAFLGINGGGISWGTMLQQAMGSGAAVAGFWWLIVAPGLAILVVVLAFTLVSRALETVVNPTLGDR
ncbi:MULTISPECIES: ABC transporter permease [unclassified Leucobacter]|uniref:ABC transporter permease n=1 Tax=unclassified Leucobacter TaxID=2621730 RepID=UPI00165E7AF4|nr:MULTISPECIES: ABC transporter permease [unclassified Leucobacter]MBC9928365.1 ABC transporter permease [Leucobacter sp. cx-169]